MKFLKVVSTVALAGAASLAMANMASAATCSNLPLSGPNTQTLTVDDHTRHDCGPAGAGFGPGYDSGGAGTTQTFFGTSYTKASATDVSVSNPLVAFDDGEWEFTANVGMSSVLIYIFQSSVGAAFEVGVNVAATDMLDGSWGSQKFNRGSPTSTNDLSHYSIWYIEGDNDGGSGFEVPLPASLPLLLGGVAGFGIIRRKKHKMS